MNLSKIVANGIYPPTTYSNGLTLRPVPNCLGLGSVHEHWNLDVAIYYTIDLVTHPHTQS